MSRIPQVMKVTKNQLIRIIRIITQRIFFLVQLFSLKNTNQDFVSDASVKCTNCSHAMAAPQAVYLSAACNQDIWFFLYKSQLIIFYRSAEAADVFRQLFVDPITSMEDEIVKLRKTVEDKVLSDLELQTILVSLDPFF